MHIIERRYGFRPRHPALWAVIAALLVVPLVAMRVTSQVAWTGSDFAAAALLLVGTGVLYEIATRLTADRTRQRMIGAALLAIVLVLWADGAIGVFR